MGANHKGGKAISMGGVDPSRYHESAKLHSISIDQFIKDWKISH